MAVNTNQKLKRLIREVVHDALQKEFMKLRALAVPNVSIREQRDIERRYKRPSRKITKTVVIEI